ncbi:MAG: HAMP domain-containing histidine kinase [Ruminococcus sp.]|nr:HAMP domain-containing histidine kinase [Ruminococcus sp.]
MKNSESKIRIIDMSEEGASEGKKRKTFTITSSMIAKVVAFLLAIMMTLTLAACVVSAVLMAGFELYSIPKAVMLRQALTAVARKDCDYVIPRFLPYYAYDGVLQSEDLVESYFDGSSVVSVKFTDSETGELMWNYAADGNVIYNEPMEISYEWEKWTSLFNSETGEWREEKTACVDVEMVISTEYGIRDKYYIISESVDFLYSMLYWVYVVGVVALILVIACVVFLVCSSGHRVGYEGVKAGWGTKVPFDILTALTAGFVILCIVLFRAVADELFYYDEIAVTSAIVPIAAVAISLVVSACLGWLMSFALRIKLGKWWRNTVVFYVLRALWRFAKFLWRQCRRLFGAIRNIPLIWKTFLSVVGITILEFIIIMCCWWEPDNLLSFWVVEKLILIPIVLNTVFTMKKLQKGAKALSEGDLSYQVDTEKMWGDFKSHGENLNSIAEGMTVAVDERMKSERMKTELITNVSHDIKTPLTSIINYTDLIANEPCDNVKITEYAKVLARSSERLKRLIEDLVEASKASTGNLEVLLAPCNTNILLTQAVGEYGDKLRDVNLELIVTQPEEAVMIMADGRRLWRVFDNLFNNVCKYAQEFTRVYLSLEKTGEEAVITLKNTSRVALNISEEELMERFVRGDQSRNTEGNGLGLSIARSLTQLQDGDLQLSIDGDLFKVTLRFPLMK